MIVVTGANGFLGAHLVAQLLLKGESVKALIRKEASLLEFTNILKHCYGIDNHAEKDLKWEVVDIFDVFEIESAFENASKVFHCLAMVDFNKSNKKQLHKVNVIGAENIVNACLTQKVSKLIHVSSTAAIGRSKENLIITEDVQWEEDGNNTEYAETKHLAELEVWRGIQEGLNAVIVNPSIILGYGNWDKGSCNFFKKMYHKFPFYTNGVNAFVGVKDVAKAMIYLADSDINNERFLLISENLSYQTIFKTIAKALDKKPPSIEIKKSYLPLLKILLKIYGVFNPKSQLTIETMRTSTNSFEYSNKKVAKVLPFEFQKIDAVIEEAAVIYKEKR